MQSTRVALSDFLLERIAEDEQAARSGRDVRVGAFVYPDMPVEVTLGLGWWQPSRVLAECEAKRRIVGQYLGTAAAHSKATDAVKQMVLELAVETLGDTLRALALPYATHPDYDESWRQ